MKIFELENAGVYNLFEPKKGVDLDRADKWDRRAADASCALRLQPGRPLPPIGVRSTSARAES